MQLDNHLLKRYRNGTGTSASLRDGAAQLGTQAVSSAASAAASAQGESVHAAREHGVVAAILKKLKVASVQLRCADHDQLRSRLTQLDVVVACASHQEGGTGDCAPAQNLVDTLQAELDHLAVPRLRSEVDESALVSSLSPAAQNGCSH